jgi:hypothetical protein
VSRRRDLANVSAKTYVMPVMIRAAMLALLSMVFSLPAQAEDAWGDVGGAELRRTLSGNTLTGRHDDGMPYSEWHAPDGRVFGHNNREPVVEGCWDIRGNQVCYYYAGGSNKGEFCWEFRRVTETGFRLKLMDRPSRMEASGMLQSGNPHRHTDNGKPWACEPLQSRNMTPRHGGTRHASR